MGDRCRAIRNDQQRDAVSRQDQGGNAQETGEQVIL